MDSFLAIFNPINFLPMKRSVFLLAALPLIAGACNQYYSEDDFASVRKIDAHAHVDRYELVDARALGSALAEIERRAQASSPKTAAQLVPLFQEWIDLLFKYKRLRQLRSISRKI